MEIKGISRPSEPADKEEQPILCRQLRKQTERVHEFIILLPLAASLAIGIRHDHALLPNEEILEGLLSSSDDALGKGVGRLADGSLGLVVRSHCEDKIKRCKMRGEVRRGERQVGGEGGCLSR